MAALKRHQRSTPFVFFARMGFVAIPLLLVFFFAGALAAQEVLSWQGSLHNTAQAPIANARILLNGKAKAEVRTASDGSFHIAGLAAGSYRLVIESAGKKATYAQLIEVTKDQPEALLMLSPRGEITVTAAKAQSGTGGEALSSQAVSELPLNKRDFSSLLLLAAGTMTDANGSTNFTAQFAINGQRGVEATFALDGADISDPEMGGATFSNFNVDAVDGIDSSSGWMPAEVGRGASGFTNIRTRSGASGFHGSFFEFLRNSSLDARNYFDHETLAYPGRIPPFRRNEFGFTNGGPILIPKIFDGRGHTYYFTEYQGFRQVLGTPQVMPVPTADQRPNSAGIVEESLKFADGSTDTLLLPVDSKIAAILKRYPEPNLTTGSYGVNTYATASKVVTNADQFSVRLDHAFTPRTQFMARFSLDNINGPTTNPDQTAVDPTFAVEYIDRQRSVVGTLTHSFTPHLSLESSLSITRSTPGFPTVNHTDPAVKFNDGLFEGFNTSGGSVMQSYGNLIQSRENLAWNLKRHSIKAGFEARLNRDTTYFGMSPNGEYDFGGGAAYATSVIQSKSGNHNIAIGQAMPDTFSSFITGAPFVYTAAIAAEGVSGGEHIGPAAANREGYGGYLEDSWRITPTFTLDYGIRWDVYTPISERAHRTSALRMINGTQRFVVNPQPGYQTEKNGFQPRLQLSWAESKNLTLHAGAGIMLVQPNIWQDNFLTGSTPFVIYPRRVSSAVDPLSRDFSISSSQLPTAYDLNGKKIITGGSTKSISPNTIMDTDRYQSELAKTLNSNTIDALNLSSIEQKFGNGSLYTWTLGFERKIAAMTATAAYVGTAASKLPRIIFPNAFPGAVEGFTPYTQYDSAGQMISGFGVENVINAGSHSTYHALQASISGSTGRLGPSIQASYTFSKSIDDASGVQGGTGSTGAIVVAAPEDPFHFENDRAVSNFDVKHGFGLSLAQDLHLDSMAWLSLVPKKLTSGWELLSISSLSSGSPFTIYSGVQQTGAGTQGADRPDQIAKPTLSVSHKDRADYFGKGTDNAATYFSIPTGLAAGGSGPNAGRYGKLTRNTFRGPSYKDFDFSLIKDTPFGHRRSGIELIDLQFRGEFFNLFNIANFGLPANTLTGSGFGQISKTAGTSRQIQLSLKLVY